MKRRYQRANVIFNVALLGLISVAEPAPTQKVHAVFPSCTAPPPGVVAWWPGDTDASDIVGGNEGTLQNGATISAGLVGNAFEFDGLDDFVVVPNSAVLSAAGPFSVEFWFSPAGFISPSDAVSHVFWSKGFDDSIDTGNGQGIIEVRGPVPRPISTTDTWPANSWQHVGLTFDGIQYVLYINGVVEDSRSSSYSIINNAEDLVFGRFLTNALSNFAGQLDEITHYNRALDSAEVGGIYQAGPLGKCRVPTSEALILEPSADTGVRSGHPDRNYGGSDLMRVRANGNNRALVRFDQAALAAAIGSGTVLSATLRLTIVDNGNNWGLTGGTVDAHRMQSNWAEGNGTEPDRGTGPGATWNCSTDATIANQASDCAGPTTWEMGQPNNPAAHPWAQTPTNSQIIANGQTGVIEYDVTADVTAFAAGSSANFGWILRKTDEGPPGSISFATREGTTAAQLITTYLPAS